MDAAACIGCGACVAMCPNASASLVHRAPRFRTWACCRRASPSGSRAPGAWWRNANREGFGSCTNIGECEAVCPKEIKLEVIARMNRETP
jgi:succinate dehydrogenase / fumarate reductase, iron-sulfur subunit